MISDAIGHPLVELEVAASGGQARQVDVEQERLAVEQYGERLEVLRDVEDARQANALLGVVRLRVPVGHGVHDERAYDVRVVRLIPRVLQDHRRVRMVVQEDGHQHRDQLLLDLVPYGLHNEK